MILLVMLNLGLRCVMMKLDEFLKNKGWEFYQTGPNEGQWLIWGSNEAIAWQGDTLWDQHLQEWDNSVK
jgi:hypothetical protein